MSATIVLGAQWGDEGKGKLTDMLARESDVVVRFSGGANAGHTIVHGDKEFITHLLPTGVLNPDCMNIIGNGCIMDPEGLNQEIRDTRDAGLDVSVKNLMISANTHLVTPMHKFLDSIEGGKWGTTKRGIGQCVHDKVARYGIRAGDILTGKLEEKYIRLENYYKKLLPAVFGTELECVGDYGKFESAMAILAPCVQSNDKIAEYLYAVNKVGNIMFEGAQGTMLDPDVGDYPDVTSTNTTIGAAYTGTGVYLPIERRIGIVKAYSTRVGTGPMPTEQEGAVGEVIRKVGKEYGATTGRPRRCGWLDLHQLKRTVRANGLTDIALTKLDTLGEVFKAAEMGTFKVCKNYTEEGEPEYANLETWTEDIRGITKYEDLPNKAKTFISLVESTLKVPVTYIGTGPERDEIIIRD